MREYETKYIRNLGLVGHGASGKTSLAEAFLFSSGVTTRMGRIEDGSTKSDHDPEEIQRQISISSSLLHCEWKDYKLNIIDTPGYMDFMGEVKGALRALDSAVVILDGVSGVEVGTEKVWNFIEEYQISCFFFVNKIGKEHVDFDRSCQMIFERFGNRAIPIQFPVNQGVGVNTIADLVNMKLLVYSDSKGHAQEKEIPGELRQKAEELRQKIIDVVAESDDQLLEKYLEEGELSQEDLITGLRNGVINRKIFPILCGDAISNIGTNTLLDAICDYLPSPADMPSQSGKRADSNQEVSVAPKTDGPLVALVFKTISEAHMGELSYARIYSGLLRSGEDVLNSTRSSVERVGQIYFLNGKDRQEIGNVVAGDIAVLVKLKDTHTGDTLCDRRSPVVLAGADFPKPIIQIAVEPKAKGDEDKISMGLARLHEEDQTFIFETNPELKQTIVSGQGELHLEVVVKKLKSRFGVDVDLTTPRIPYRETIMGNVEAHHRYKKQSGGRGQYGEVYIRLEPLARGSGYEFVDAITGGAIPGKFIPAVEKGVVDAMEGGVLAGYRVVDVKVSLYDGTFHTVDSSELAFKLAGSMAFKKGFMEAKPILLEPIYDVEVVVPEEYMGDVIGDLSSRRGKILGMEADGYFQNIKAKVPLAELHKYSTSLRSLTQGRGGHTREFSHFEQVPHEIAEKIIAESGHKKEEE